MKLGCPVYPQPEAVSMNTKKRAVPDALLPRRNVVVHNPAPTAGPAISAPEPAFSQQQGAFAGSLAPAPAAPTYTNQQQWALPTGFSPAPAQPWPAYQQHLGTAVDQAGWAHIQQEQPALLPTPAPTPDMLPLQTSSQPLLQPNQPIYDGFGNEMDTIVDWDNLLKEVYHPEWLQYGQTAPWVQEQQVQHFSNPFPDAAAPQVSSQATLSDLDPEEIRDYLFSGEPSPSQ